MTPFNPDSWMDVAALGFLGLTAALPAILPVWAKLKRIDDQVSNTHSTNLRDDLDGLGDSINAGFAENRKEFQLLHEALNIERRERIAGDARREQITGDALQIAGDVLRRDSE